MSVYKEYKKITTHSIQEMKMRGEKISMLTAYDFSMAKIFDEAKIDVLLGAHIGVNGRPFIIYVLCVFPLLSSLGVGAR